MTTLIGMMRVACLLVVLPGCANSEYRGESRAPNLPPFTGKVVLLETFPPSGTFERLGVVTVESYGVSYANTLTDRISKEAAARGANAVVLQAKPRERRDAKGHTSSILAGWAIRLKN